MKHTYPVCRNGPCICPAGEQIYWFSHWDLWGRTSSCSSYSRQTRDTRLVLLKLILNWQRNWSHLPSHVWASVQSYPPHPAAPSEDWPPRALQLWAECPGCWPAHGSHLGQTHNNIYNVVKVLWLYACSSQMGWSRCGISHCSNHLASCMYYPHDPQAVKIESRN